MTRAPAGLTLLSLAVAGLAGCGWFDDSRGEVLAKVDGQKIYQADLDAAWDRTFTDADAMVGGEAVRHRLLESLVASRVLARKAEAALSDEEEKALERDMAAWREEQLVKRYLAEQTTPDPVTPQMVEEYYKAHPELFGGGRKQHYESLTAKVGNDDRLRDRAIALLRSPGGDWQAAATAGSRDGLVVEYGRGVADALLADAGLRAQLSVLKEGQASPMSMAGGTVTVYRVTRVETSPPKPLSEVSADIRQRLAPMQLKKAVKAAMETAMRDVEVEYFDAPAEPPARD